jgi:hypothetical protein
MLRHTGKQPLHEMQKLSLHTEDSVEEAQRGDEDEMLQVLLLVPVPIGR